MLTPVYLVITSLKNVFKEEGKIQMIFKASIMGGKVVRKTSTQIVPSSQEFMGTIYGYLRTRV